MKLFHIHRLVAEQVSHHPPISAFHAEHKNYIFSGSMLPKMKFYGKSVEIIPKGVMTVVLRRYVFMCSKNGLLLVGKGR